MKSKMNRYTGCLCFLFFFIMVLSGAGPDRAEQKEKIIIFHAGSLTVPLAAMEKAFEKSHPNYDVLREGGGSTKMARMISELDKPADIMASADFTVIDKVLIPEKARWNIRFASNQLVLCYTAKSRFADEIKADNWYEILARPGVVWGHSEPNLDPCGYRSLMVLQLAESYYNRPGLYQRLIDNRPERNVRPRSVELISLLKTGNMDYAWEYLSVAVQQDLQYIVLPNQINLGDYNYDQYYSRAKVKVSGSKPGEWITQTGKSCTYGITLINGAPNSKGAILFLQYLLSPEGGLKILKDMGQPPFIPCRVPSQEMYDLMPASLKNLVEVKN